ncbi:LacI family DNA-binding transcriptional regulator [Tropicibacter sp. R15_0]|uniref:LacI family DNA-binding transcriptional regulator n=1 Tax=Tropicibacter sp. R15_0 TaxID=2821101 RepID=UPI001ADADAD7|nr:LacI family DNA-binding transcriptional regulator [Tropicibacter sp. R15_0]MBO9467767.1 LacI family DNA-binding transcriptional regulator [Tropicibacter sp. R15_0]
MAKGRPTIIDVARKAGVSKSTVSLVLQNSPTVRDETRKQVRAAMADLGYVYNRSAANMRKSNAGLIGLVINDLRNPFFTEFATSLQMALSARGYAAVVANTDESPELQDQVVNSMIEHGVSALIICPAYGDTRGTFDAIARAGLPAMQMLRRVDDRLDLFPFTAPDYVAGTRAATQHLIDQGANTIAFVGGLEGRAVTEERMSGYRQVLGENGKTPVILTGQATRQFGRDSAQGLAPEIDAVLCFNDLVALGMIAGFREAGHQARQAVPRIVGFDDIEDAAQTYPALSSVHCDIAAIGKGAAQTVLAWVEDGQTPPPETRTPVRLVVRASSA